jgi:excisionase family DNA binding protein
VQPLPKADGRPGAPPRFYTVNETADMLRTSAITMYRAINDGEFPAIRVRGRLIVPAKVIDALIDAAIDTYSLVDAADWVPESAVPMTASPRGPRRRRGLGRPRPGANQTGAGSPVTQQGARGEVYSMPDPDSGEPTGPEGESLDPRGAR